MTDNNQQQDVNTPHPVPTTLSDDDTTNPSSTTTTSGPPPRMPPRAKSSYHPRRSRLSSTTTTMDAIPISTTTEFSPATTRVPLRRRASFATVPDSKPPIRRGMSVVPRRRGSGAATFVGVRQNRHSLASGDTNTIERTPEERAFADEVRAARAAAAAAAAKEEPAVCGMCGNCREGLAAMPEWAPERMAKMTPEEQHMVRMNMRAKEEAGKIASEIRKAGLIASINGTDSSEIPNTEKRTPLRRHSSRLSAVLAPGNNSDARRRPKFVAKPSPERMLQLENQEMAENKTMEVQNEVKMALPNPRVETTEMDIFGASDSDTVDCADCDDLEERVKDLEEQLGVLREVVKVSGGDPGMSTNSDSLDMDTTQKGKKESGVA